ncbi:hypothetical protein YPPY01_1764, partial [Yersinia pestis PY-01]
MQPLLPVKPRHLVHYGYRRRLAPAHQHRPVTP